MPGASAGTSSVSPISQRARSHSSICLSPDASERSTAAPRLIPSVEPVHSGGSGEHIDTKAAKTRSIRAEQRRRARRRLEPWRALLRRQVRRQVRRQMRRQVRRQVRRRLCRLGEALECERRQVLVRKVEKVRRLPLLRLSRPQPKTEAHTPGAGRAAAPPPPASAPPPSPSPAPERNPPEERKFPDGERNAPPAAPPPPSPSAEALSDDLRIRPDFGTK